MTSELSYPFTTEQIQQQTRGNLEVVVLISIAYAKAQGKSPRDYALFAGKLVASSWAQVSSPREAATVAALSSASFGISVVSVGGDDTRGEAVTGDWPPTDYLEALGLTQEDADAAWAIYEPVAQSLGYTYIGGARATSSTSASRSSIPPSRPAGQPHTRVTVTGSDLTP